jgi:uncharacterized membrane protein YfcA
MLSSFFFGSLTLLAWLAAVSLLAGVIKGVSGFGAALIMAPLFGLWLPPSHASALVILLHAATALQGWRNWSRLVHWKSVTPLALVALACTMGAVVILLTLLHVGGWRWQHQGGVAATLSAGLASGAMTALGGMGGAPAVYYFSGGPGGKAEDHHVTARLRANLLGYFCLLFLGASLILGLQRHINVAVLASSAVLVPVFAAGVLIGERLYRHLPACWINFTVTALLLGSGLLSLLR